MFSPGNVCRYTVYNMYVSHNCDLYIVALTSVDKGSFLDMLSNKSSNEKSMKKGPKVINTFYCNLYHF